MTTATLLIAALCLDALLGEPRWLWDRVPHPAVLMGRLVDLLDRRFNTGSRRRLKGGLCLCVLILTGALIGGLIGALGPVAEVLTAAVLLAQRSLVQHVAQVAEGLRISLDEGRRAVAQIVSRDTAGMDETRAARAAIESGAENLSDGVIAPAFWFLAAGAPGIVIYKLINTADSMIGYRTLRHEAFGWAAARLDDLLNLIPARLTAVLISGAARVVAPAAIRRDARQHRSPNAGWPEAAMARALGVALAGPRAYDGTLRDFPFVNAEGRMVLGPADIDASVTLLWKTWIGALVLCGLLALL